MSYYSLEKLIEALQIFPGVGYKTAQRFAYTIINMSDNNLKKLSQSMFEAKEKIRFCNECGGYSETDVCDICSKRNKKIICVVKEPKDIMAFEKTRSYKGVYHVLHGAINPLRNVGIDDVKIKELLARLDGVEEVILATNFNIEGEATAMYLARLLKAKGIFVTRISNAGIATGTEIEYMDDYSKSMALQNRKEYY